MTLPINPLFLVTNNIHLQREIMVKFGKGVKQKPTTDLNKIKI